MQTKRFLTDNRGQYVVQLVVWFPVLLLMLGMVVDGGLIYWQYRRAHNAVNLAAQAASQCVDIPYFLAENRVRLDQAEAAGVASNYVALNGGGRVQLAGVYTYPYLVVVRGRATINTLFVQAAGLGPFTVEVEGQAYPAFGIAAEGQ